MFAGACARERDHVVQLSRVSEWCYAIPGPVIRALIEKVTGLFGEAISKDGWRAKATKTAAPHRARRAGGEPRRTYRQAAE
jgi:hypothetical protein